jgi:hypothetical protein
LQKHHNLLILRINNISNKLFLNLFKIYSTASVSIPKGSILAVGSISIIYIMQIIFFGSTVVRYATGNIADVQYNNYTCNESQGCDYGLINDQIVSH